MTRCPNEYEKGALAESKDRLRSGPSTGSLDKVTRRPSLTGTPNAVPFPHPPQKRRAVIGMHASSRVREGLLTDLLEVGPLQGKGAIKQCHPYGQRRVDRFEVKALKNMQNQFNTSSFSPASCFAQAQFREPSSFPMTAPAELAGT